MPYGVVISEIARASLAEHGPAARARVERALLGLAELADVAPPIDPSWGLLASSAPPLMRTSVGPFRVTYDLDPVERTLRVIDVHLEA